MITGEGKTVCDAETQRPPNPDGTLRWGCCNRPASFTGKSGVHGETLDVCSRHRNLISFRVEKARKFVPVFKG